MSLSVESIQNWFQHSEFVARCPRRITMPLRQFSASLDADPPVFLTPAPMPHARLALCFQNVSVIAEQGKGEMQTGWLLWQMETAYLVAERHAVLRTSTGLVDITPQPDGAQRILFAPTPGPPPTRTTPCRYFALSQHPLVLRSVQLMERNQALIGSTGYRASQYYRNDAESARCLRAFLASKARQSVNRCDKAQRAKRKAERQRRKRNRS